MFLGLQLRKSKKGGAAEKRRGKKKKGTEPEADASVVVNQKHNETPSHCPLPKLSHRRVLHSKVQAWPGYLVNVKPERDKTVGLESGDGLAARRSFWLSSWPREIRKAEQNLRQVHEGAYRHGATRGDSRGEGNSQLSMSRASYQPQV